MSLSARTELAGVIGSPVRHSLSPLLHNAAYRALGLDWAYLAFEVAPADLATAVRGAAALGLRGLSVTMPHKDEAAALADRRSPAVRRLGAANTLSFSKGAIAADSTDGAGLLADLSVSLGFDPAGSRCGVIGAGGAARAAVLALAEAGAAEVLVVNRTPLRAFRAASLAPGVARLAKPDELEGADLVVQATPSGMLAGEGEEPGWPAGVDPARLGSGQIVVDLVYEPAETAFLREARRFGAVTRNGLGMLVHQAALQVALWTGERPPLSAMWEAVPG